MIKKLTPLAAALSLAFVTPAMADDIGGTAVMDFHQAELEIPCVLLENADGGLDGMYFDVVLKQRGGSMNFELSFAAAEDPSVCDAISDFAEETDDDYVDDDCEDDEDDMDDEEDDAEECSADDDEEDDEDDSDDDSSDDDSSDDDSSTGA